MVWTGRALYVQVSTALSLEEIVESGCLLTKQGCQQSGVPRAKARTAAVRQWQRNTEVLSAHCIHEWQVVLYAACATGISECCSFLLHLGTCLPECSRTCGTSYSILFTLPVCSITVDSFNRV